MAELCCHSPSFGKLFRHERRQLVPILLMTGEWEHLTAKSEELDAILVVPAQHLHNVFGVGFSETFYELLTSSNIGLLRSIWTVLSRVWWLIRVRQWVSVLNN